jgi:hypothetical protein
MSLLSSPRRRRRLAWAGGVAAAVAVVVVVALLVPSHGGPPRTAAPRPPVLGGGPTTTGAGFGSSRAEERAAERAVRQVRPLANRFVDDLVGGRTADAARLASPKLHVPRLQLEPGPGPSVAFSGASTVGFVASFPPDVLLALRFDNANGRWLATYLHQGHSSSHVSAADYSPAGFAPGSRHETRWTILALVGGLVLAVGIGVAAERALR